MQGIFWAYAERIQNEYDGWVNLLSRTINLSIWERHMINLANLFQTKYYKELIQKIGMENSKSLGTPSSTCSLDKDEEDKKVDETKYRGMIGPLLHLIASWPNIIFNLCKCARF